MLDHLQQEQETLTNAGQKLECVKTLFLDVLTRWNSTYLMLNTAQNFEKAFNMFDENFGTLSFYSCL